LSEPFLGQWRQHLRAKVATFDANDQLAAAETRPLPPPVRIRQVNSAEKADPLVFLRSGASDLLAIVETLEEAVESGTLGAGLPFPARPAVMELGCGVGGSCDMSRRQRWRGSSPLT
jgi:hypothetical protein